MYDQSLTRRQSMNSLTRRNVLMLAGAAGLTPVLGSVALGEEDVKAPKKCDLVIKDGLQLLIKKKLFSEGTKECDIEYASVDGDAFVCFLPWAPHHALKCPRKQKDAGKLKKHRFTFEAVMNGTVEEIKGGGGKLDHVRITCDADYGRGYAEGDKRPAVCHIMCDGVDHVVPAGQSFFCHGVEIKCPARMDGDS
jgi:hypothetical protein